jgi:uncharacterized protein YbjT (DUF2867 family)
VAEVLVTGGTGTLGRAVVAALLSRGHLVRVLSRRGGESSPGAADADGPRTVRGDLASGAGLTEAVAGTEAIVHCASATGTLRRRTQREVDVAGTRRLAAAARAASRPHLVYPSIVGIDGLPLAYYRTKSAAETEVERSELPWTILRATQFHDLLLMALGGLHRGPLLFLPRGFRFQPVDAGEVGERLAELVDAGPGGRVGDLGGPEELSADEIAERYLGARGGSRPWIVRVAVPGRMARAVRGGGQLCRGCAAGAVSFGDFVGRAL